MKTKKGDPSARPRRGASPPRWMLWLWPSFDRLLARLLHIEPLDPTNGVMGISFAHHKGGPHALKDGTLVRPGSLLVEIHVLNSRLTHLALTSPSKEVTPWHLAKLMSRDLSVLAKQVEAAPEIEALHGTTLLDSGVRRLGFSVVEAPQGPSWKVIAFYERGLLLAYHSRGAQEMAKKAGTLMLKELWMSRKELLARYGAGSP